MNALPVARLFGFEIRIHVSWALILALIAVTVVTQVDVLAPDATPVVGWLIGGIVAAGVLGSALAHELGHAVVARRAGLPGGPVIVYVFGGAAGPDLEAARPRDEAMVALAGPLVSLGLGVGLALVFAVTIVLGSAAGGAATTIGRIAAVIGALNLLLGLVNLLPAYPLDGGRVIRAVVWARTGDAAEGLRAAARTGRWLGRIAAFVGLAVVLLVDAIDGLFLAAFGWFLISISRAVERSADVDDLLEGIVVDDVMERDVTGIPAGLTLDTFAGQLLDGSASGAVPVMRDHEVIGILGARQVMRIRRDRWPTTHASDIVVASASLPAVTPAMSIRDVLDLLQRNALDGLPVHEGGVLAGMVTRRAVAAAVRAREAARGVKP